MKRILIALCVLPLLWSGAGQAQDEEQQPPNLGAIEMFMCNYNKGKGPKDLDRAVAKWNAWADKVNYGNYNAWTLTPVFASPDYNFDIAWLGAWKNGTEMGKGLQQWKDEGGAMQAEFDKALTCEMHASYTSANFKPQQGDWPKEGLTVFTDCTVAEGKRFEDSIVAHAKWAKHLQEIGSKAGMWAFYPMFGGGDQSYDYKIVMAHPDYLSLGKDHDDYTNGEGWKIGREVSEDVVSCNTPRVYNSVLRRNGGVTGD